MLLLKNEKTGGSVYAPAAQEGEVTTQAVISPENELIKLHCIALALSIHGFALGES